jgi:Na+-transporting NADH:ubiquinone oxidoreductase subunit NqrD
MVLVGIITCILPILAISCVLGRMRFMTLLYLLVLLGIIICECVVLMKSESYVSSILTELNGYWDGLDDKAKMEAQTAVR